MQPFLKAPEGVAIEYYDGTEEIDLPLVWWSHFNEAEQLHVWEVLDPHPGHAIKALTVEVLPPHSQIKIAR